MDLEKALPKRSAHGVRGAIGEIDVHPPELFRLHTERLIKNRLQGHQLFRALLNPVTCDFLFFNV